MKNLLIYISDTKSFTNSYSGGASDAALLAKIQVENSLSLGWRPEDIIFVTNFDFQYGPVKAIILADVQYFQPYPKASKINAIVEMFEKGLIKENLLYWFHDLDAHQLIPFTEQELKLDNADMGLASYDAYDLPPDLLKIKKWNTGSIFFKQSSKDIFYRIKEIMYDHEIREEKALTELTNNYSDIRSRVKMLNHTYDFVPWLRSDYSTFDKPMRVAHFHTLGDPPEWLDKNTRLIPDRLVKIFNRVKYHKS